MPHGGVKRRLRRVVVKFGWGSRASPALPILGPASAILGPSAPGLAPAWSAHLSLQAGGGHRNHRLGTERSSAASGKRGAAMQEIPTLVVDDEPSIRDLLRLQLGAMGCQVACAADGREALDAFGKEPFDLIFTDIRMPRMSGIQLLQEIRALTPEISVVVLS